MRIDTLMISLFLLTLGAIGCSQPEAVKAEYEPANCDCVEQPAQAETPPAQSNGLADEAMHSSTNPPSTNKPTALAQAAQRKFMDPAEATPGEHLQHEPGAPDEQAQPAADSDEAPKKAEEAKEKAAKGDPNGVINLNTASAKQLTALPGVGPALAARIVEFRQQRRFEEPKHLLRVRGIGKATFAKLAPMLTVSGATTLAK